MGLSGPQVPRGPARWERARRHAERNPTSANAALYRSRLELAQTAESEFFGRDSAFDFLYLKWSDRSGTAPKVEFRVCSVACAAMQLSLEVAGENVNAEIMRIIADALNDVPWAPSASWRSGVERFRKRDPQAQKRDVRCLVCAATIKVDGEIIGKDHREYQTPKPLPSTEDLVLKTARSLNDELRKALAEAQESLRQNRELNLRLSEQNAELMARANHMVDSDSFSNLFYLSPDGFFTSVLDLPIVQFDDDDLRNILQTYASIDGRRRYLNENGGDLRGVL